MFAQAIQLPTQGYTCSTGFNPNEALNLCWNAQPVISSAILQNELLGRINSLGAGDFFGITNQYPGNCAVNSGLAVNHLHPGITTNGLGLGSFGLNGFSPVAAAYGVNPHNGLHAGLAAQSGFLPVNQFGGNSGSYAHATSGCGLLGVIDNDTEIVFELALPGVSASHVDVCVVNSEIRVRLTNGSATTSKTAGSRATGSNTTTRTPVCCLTLPCFCDASKVTAKVEQGRLTITCPRTAEYVKNITRVKVS